MNLLYNKMIPLLVLSPFHPVGVFTFSQRSWVKVNVFTGVFLFSGGIGISGTRSLLDGRYL